jgi:hypothetical protein
MVLASDWPQNTGDRRRRYRVAHPTDATKIPNGFGRGREGGDRIPCGCSRFFFLRIAADVVVAQLASGVAIFEDASR